MAHSSAPADTNLPVARYSSAGQRPQDRHAEWREGSLLAFGRLYDTVPTEPFSVETGLTQLGAIGFSHSRMSGQRWRRTREHIGADAADPLMVAIRFEGTAQGNANGRDFAAPAGCIGLSDFAQPQSYVSGTAFSAVLSIPRELAERTLPAVRSLHGLVIAPSEATLLRSHARAMIEALEAGLPAWQGERLGRITLDLLELGIAKNQSWGPITPSAAATGARLTAEAAIDRNLALSTLTIDDLCGWVGVSRATLYRLFETEGGVQAYIKARRLARIEEDLRFGGKVPLTELAERWGFADASHLSRQFRAQYGMSPADFRAENGRSADQQA